MNFNSPRVEKDGWYCAKCYMTQATFLKISQKNIVYTAFYLFCEGLEIFIEFLSYYIHTATYYRSRWFM